MTREKNKDLRQEAQQNTDSWAADEAFELHILIYILLFEFLQASVCFFKSMYVVLC